MLFTVCEVVEGKCKGKFVIQNFLGGFVNDGEGSVSFFDTAEQATAVMENTYRNLTELIESLDNA